MTFDLQTYLDERIDDIRLLDISEGRVELCRFDPLLFALIYLPHHITDETMGVTFNEFHLNLIDWAKSLITKPTAPMQFRDAFIAPRECGKSTWLFTIIPMWAAAYGYVKFIAAFSDAANQAETHLITFKRELDSNDYLKSDFPDLCKPMLVQGTNKPIANNASRIWQANDFIFDVNGIDTNSLGKKVGVKRPDFIILDDIEPDEKGYTSEAVKKQRNTVFDAIAPMNMKARMVFVGTTTMPDSIMDQFRKHYEGDPDPALEWISEQNVQVHYWPAILPNDDGSERSIWPEKWSLEWLQSRRHTRDFAKNFMNRPVSSDGTFWNDTDIRVEPLEDYGFTMLSIDPAVTKGKVSDYTGLAVLSKVEGKVYVRWAGQVKMSPAELRSKITQMVEDYEVGLILVETNQGGDLWHDVFKDVPCRYKSIKQSVSKEIRAGKCLNYYQQGKVLHTDYFPALVEQMLAFPKTRHDDVLDAVTSGVNILLKPAVKVSATQYSYI